jgi:hypothetical protein
VRVCGAGGDDDPAFLGRRPKLACRYANVYDQVGKAAHNFGWETHGRRDGAANTSPVGRYRLNAFGL